MTDKKTFGLFIKAKRTEKNYSQKDLAEKLFITEGAVSKWERGVSYPDITLIADICRVLQISEHELITASIDTDTRKMKHEARKFRVIRGTWFWVPTISYAITLLTCFICNLAVNHTLSWFFIVLSALICAYTFVPTVTYFFVSNRLLAFSVSTYLSICMLLFTCAFFADGFSWFLTACIGVLIGYEILFLPFIISKTKLSRYKFVIPLTIACILTVLLLINVNIWYPIKLLPSILITCYAFAPAITASFICTMRFNALVKAGIVVCGSAIHYYFTEFMVDLLFGLNESSYRVDFNNWEQNIEGNVHLISISAKLFIGSVLFVIGFLRARKNKKQ